MTNNIVEPISFQNNLYPNIINKVEKNPIVRSPYATTDLYFYQTRETLKDVDQFRNFLRNCEMRFRSSKEYKLYKSYLIEYIGINRCQVFGNIGVDDASIELHHNILGLFDICLMITLHIVNTTGFISTFDLIQILIEEHKQNNVGVTFLSKTAHQMFTNDPNAYIPPEMTFGSWWVLLDRYKYGITYDIANKVIGYLKKYQENTRTSLNIPLQDQVLSFAYYNEYGMNENDCQTIESEIRYLEEEDNNYDQSEYTNYYNSIAC